MPKPSEQAAFGIYPQAGKRGQRKPTAKEQLAQIFSDERAMDLPKFGEVDLDVPSAANRAMGQRMVERDVDLKRQADRDMSPLEKIAGGMQTGRLIGSGLVNMAKSIPTAITKGGKAAEEYIAENIYKPTVPKAYEYAEDIGNFLQSLESDYKIPPIIPEAMMLQNVIGPATRQAGRAAQQGARQGALNLAAPRTLNPQAGVIKMKGGNWQSGSIEKALKPLKRQTAARNDPAEMLTRMRERYTPEEIAKLPEGVMRTHVLESIADLEKDVALNNWVERNLGNYVKKEMATPEDPVRRLAEEGISHLPEGTPRPRNMSAVWDRREAAGFPKQEGVSRQAHVWEALADNPIRFATTGETQNIGKGEPWMEKVDPFTRVHSINEMQSGNMTSDLGFDHIMDVLREDLASGRIRPEQLNKVSMEQAVRRTYEYDQEMAKRMRETALQQQEGFPLYKEYPEGYRWIELTKPSDLTDLPEGYRAEPYKSQYSEGVKIIGPDGKQAAAGDNLDEALRNMSETRLEEALKYEGDTMGHCVGGYCPDVLEGRSRIYSLRDAKGEPHVTIEVEPNQNPYPVSGEAFAMLPQATKAQYGQYVREWRQRNPNITELTDEHTAQALREAGVQPQPDRVIQIKGKQNAAPKDTYLPYVQDFVKSGQWSDVGDLGNTGLYRPQDIANFIPESFYATKAEREAALEKAKAAGTIQPYMTRSEWEEALKSQMPPPTPGPTMEFLREMSGLPPEGMARGGRVHFSDNPDVMQLELAGGGLVKKLASTVGKAAESAGMKAPVTAGKDLTTLQDVHTNLGDRVRAGAMEAKKMMEGFDYQYDKGQRVFTKDSAGKNKPPYTILNRTRVGNQVMREDHPEFGPGMGKPIIDPETGKAMRTPYEPGYRVRMERGPDDWSEFEIPQKAIVGDVEMAAGGAVQMSGGGALSKLAKLARAPAKTKAEISAIAERLAPQVTGEYVRKDAKSAKTVADKTQKQFQREKNLPVDVRPTDKERIPELVDIEKLKGDVMIGIPGDPTLTGKTLYSVGDVNLGSPSPQHGGPLYGLYNDDNFWASGLGAARRVQSLAKEAGEQYDAPVAGKYIMMGPDSINYAQHFADANLQAIDLDKMTKKQVEQFNKLIRFGNPKSGPRPSFPGIEDKESAYLHMAMDPELRKHFNELMQMPTVTESLNLPSGTDIRFAITEPSLRDLETGVTGFSVGRMRPEISSKDLSLSTHPTYSHDIPGEFIGQSRFPVPYELSFPDTLKSIRENPAQAPHEFGSLKMIGPRQIIDRQMIDEIKAYEERMRQLTGKKSGGAVRKAAGGEITADDLILEERKL